MASPMGAGAQAAGMAGQQSAQGQAPVGTPPSGSDIRAVTGEFRELAQKIQELAGKYPEFQTAAADFLPKLMKVMSQIAGNPQRVQSASAPPNVA